MLIFGFRVLQRECGCGYRDYDREGSLAIRKEVRSPRTFSLQHPHVSYNLNSLKGDYFGDYIGDYYRAY